MDASLKSGEDVMLPRKPGTKPREEGINLYNVYRIVYLKLSSNIAFTFSKMKKNLNPRKKMVLVIFKL